MAMLIAKETVWITRDHRLVPDGSKDAVFLVARKGARLLSSRVQSYPENHRFFCEVNRPRIASQSDADEEKPAKRKYTIHNKTEENK